MMMKCDMQRFSLREMEHGCLTFSILLTTHLCREHWWHRNKQIKPSVPILHEPQFKFEIQSISERRQSSVWSHFNIECFFLTALRIPALLSNILWGILKYPVVENTIWMYPLASSKDCSSSASPYNTLPSCLPCFSFSFLFFPSCLGLIRICLFLKKSNMLFKIPWVLERPFSPASTTHNYTSNSSSPISRGNKDPKRHGLIFCQNITQAHARK